MNCKKIGLLRDDAAVPVCLWILMMDGSADDCSIGDTGSVSAAAARDPVYGLSILKSADAGDRCFILEEQLTASAAVFNLVLLAPHDVTDCISADNGVQLIVIKLLDFNIILKRIGVFCNKLIGGSIALGAAFG